MLKSWAAETRPVSLSLDPDQTWLGLTVEKHQVTGAESAIVRFRAIWQHGAEQGTLVETSRFRREGPGWVYIDGEAHKARG